MPTCAPSWPWPLITNGIRPDRLRIHIRSSTARERATRRYIAMRSASPRPTDAASPTAAPSPVCDPGFCVTAIWSSASRRRGACRLPPASTTAASEVDRPAVHGKRRLAEHLRERRMRMRRAADLPRRRLELEGDRRLGDEVGRMRADEMDAERAVGVAVADDLGDPLVLTADDRLGDRLERHLAHLDRQPALLSLLLCQTDRRDLRPAIRRSRLEDVVDRVDVTVAGDGVGGDDPLVARRVREHQAADDVADRIEVRIAGPHPAINLDDATLDLGLGRLEADLFHVGRPAGRDEEHLGPKLLRLLALRSDHQADVLLRHLDCLRVEPGVRDDLDAAPLEAALELAADVTVLERHDRRQVFENGDLGTEVVEHRGELDTYRAGADDRDALGERVHPEHVVGGHDPPA